MPRMRRLTLHLVALCVAATAPAVYAVEETATEPAPDAAQAPFVVESTVAAIQEALNSLVYPVSDEQVIAILTAIGKLPDEQQQEELRQQLNDRGHELGQQAASSSSGQPALNPESSDREFTARIGALQLGQHATVADLRARDEIVSAIVGVSDPDRRERLLKELEQRERKAETLVEPPAAR